MSWTETPARSLRAPCGLCGFPTAPICFVNGRPLLGGRHLPWPVSTGRREQSDRGTSPRTVSTCSAVPVGEHREKHRPSGPWSLPAGREEGGPAERREVGAGDMVSRQLSCPSPLPAPPRPHFAAQGLPCTRRPGAGSEGWPCSVWVICRPDQHSGPRGWGTGDRQPSSPAGLTRQNLSGGPGRDSKHRKKITK